MRGKEENRCLYLVLWALTGLQRHDNFLVSEENQRCGWREFVKLYVCELDKITLGLATQNHCRNTPYSYLCALRCVQYVLMSFTSSSDRGVTWDSNLVDSASSIRLSQRLSHACLSINKSILWNCEWLIISVIVYLMVLATWITVVILELIHASNLDFFGRGVFIRWKPMRGNPDSGDS